MLPVHQVWILV